MYERRKIGWRRGEEEQDGYDGGCLWYHGHAFVVPPAAAADAAFLLHID